jgi:hypothetical protein
MNNPVNVMVYRFQRVEGGPWEYGVGIENSGVLLDDGGNVVDPVYDARSVPYRGAFVLFQD